MERERFAQPNTNIASDFLHGLYDTAVKQPIDGVRQLFGAKLEPTNEANNSMAHKAGGMVGFIIDFTVLSRITGGAADKLIGKSATGFFKSESVTVGTKMGAAGAIYGGVFTPSAEGKTLLTGRLENAALSGVTFATMGSTGKLLEDAKFLGSNKLLSRMGSNAIAGGAGGGIATLGSAYLTENRIATPSELAAGIGEMALFGAGFGALDVGIGKIAQSPRVSEKYYELKYSLESTAKDTKVKAYGFLNDYNLRHPITRIGDALTGSRSILDNQPRASLTTENNPAVAIQRELPKFYDAMERSEAKIGAVTDRKQRWEMIQEQREERTKFAEELLKLWHGTGTRPGLKQYSDAELATAEVSVSRVAEIRQALETEGRAFSEPLAKLAGRQSNESTDLLDGIEVAKERFFGYDERALEKKMSMPREHFIKDRDGLAPMSWMPFEPTPQLTNLFHGTVSKTLPGVFEERAMLPSYELRLRGLKHQGEAAGQDFGRRSISVTRDFNESWAYHRHSPMSLDTYPVVFGISADVAPKLKSAGFLEPGEQLIDKLKIGNSLATTLGIRRPEITHIYVPDAKVQEVQTLLNAYRVKGVSVVGVNDLRKPDWKPTPEFKSDEDAYEWMRSSQ